MVDPDVVPALKDKWAELKDRVVMRGEITALEATPFGQGR
jgi:hypothetical protein